MQKFCGVFVRKTPLSGTNDELTSERTFFSGYSFPHSSVSSDYFARSNQAPFQICMTYLYEIEADEMQRIYPANRAIHPRSGVSHE